MPDAMSLATGGSAVMEALDDEASSGGPSWVGTSHVIQASFSPNLLISSNYPQVI